jgi:LacI family transcriptional regulator, gluconate utilization system Gnt-I transcriptional repressor
VGVNCYDIGMKAGSVLLRAIEGERISKSVPSETLLIDYEVIPREST